MLISPLLAPAMSSASAIPRSEYELFTLIGVLMGLSTFASILQPTTAGSSKEDSTRQTASDIYAQAFEDPEMALNNARNLLSDRKNPIRQFSLLYVFARAVEVALYQSNFQLSQEADQILDLILKHEKYTKTNPRGAFGIALTYRLKALLRLIVFHNPIEAQSNLRKAVSMLDKWEGTQRKMPPTAPHYAEGWQDWHFELAWVYFLEGDIAVHKHAGAVQPDDNAFEKHLEIFSKALVELIEATKHDLPWTSAPQLHADILFRIAQATFNSRIMLPIEEGPKRISQAKRWLQESHEVKPLSATGHRLLSLIGTLQDDYQDAYRHAVLAFRIDRQNGATASLAYKAALFMGDGKKARRWLTRIRTMKADGIGYLEGLLPLYEGLTLDKTKRQDIPRENFLAALRYWDPLYESAAPLLDHSKSDWEDRDSFLVDLARARFAVGRWDDGFALFVQLVSEGRTTEPFMEDLVGGLVYNHPQSFSEFMTRVNTRDWPDREKPLLKAALISIRNVIRHAYPDIDPLALLGSDNPERIANEAVSATAEIHPLQASWANLAAATNKSNPRGTLEGFLSAIKGDRKTPIHGHLELLAQVLSDLPACVWATTFPNAPALIIQFTSQLLQGEQAPEATLRRILETLSPWAKTIPARLWNNRNNRDAITAITNRLEAILKLYGRESAILEEIEVITTHLREGRFGQTRAAMDSFIQNTSIDQLPALARTKWNALTTRLETVQPFLALEKELDALYLPEDFMRLDPMSVELRQIGIELDSDIPGMKQRALQAIDRARRRIRNARINEESESFQSLAALEPYRWSKSLLKQFPDLDNAVIRLIIEKCSTFNHLLMAYGILDEMASLPTASQKARAVELLNLRLSRELPSGSNDPKVAVSAPEPERSVPGQPDSAESPVPTPVQMTHGPVAAEANPTEQEQTAPNEFPEAEAPEYIRPYLDAITIATTRNSPNDVLDAIEVLAEFYQQNSDPQILAAIWPMLLDMSDAQPTVRTLFSSPLSRQRARILAGELALITARIWSTTDNTQERVWIETGLKILGSRAGLLQTFNTLHLDFSSAYGSRVEGQASIILAELLMEWGRLKKDARYWHDAEFLLTEEKQGNGPATVRWYRENVVHNARAHAVRIYINQYLGKTRNADSYYRTAAAKGDTFWYDGPSFKDIVPIYFPEPSPGNQDLIHAGIVVLALGLSMAGYMTSGIVMSVIGLANVGRHGYLNLQHSTIKPGAPTPALQAAA